MIQAFRFHPEPWRPTALIEAYRIIEPGFLKGIYDGFCGGFDRGTIRVLDG